MHMKVFYEKKTPTRCVRMCVCACDNIVISNKGVVQSRRRTSFFTLLFVLSVLQYRQLPKIDRETKITNGKKIICLSIAVRKLSQTELLTGQIWKLKDQLYNLVLNCENENVTGKYEVIPGAVGCYHFTTYKAHRSYLIFYFIVNDYYYNCQWWTHNHYFPVETTHFLCPPL